MHSVARVERYNMNMCRVSHKLEGEKKGHFNQHKHFLNQIQRIEHQNCNTCVRQQSCVSRWQAIASTPFAIASHIPSRNGRKCIE